MGFRIKNVWNIKILKLPTLQLVAIRVLSKDADLASNISGFFYELSNIRSTGGALLASLQ